MTRNGTFKAGPIVDAISYELDSLSDRQEYLEAASELLSRILPGEMLGWNSVDLDTRVVEVVSFPRGCWDDRTVGQELEAVMDDHPTARRFLDHPLDTAPHRLSDLVSRRELRRTRAYSELLAPLGAEEQLSILTSRPGPRGARCWTTNRKGSDFSDAELDLAKAMQPILATLDRVTSAKQQRYLEEATEPHRLTPREIEVLQQVANGLTAGATARLLRISPRTVRKHLENAYAKLGCHDRLLAARRAEELGIVPRPDHRP
jgi:DNA-binding CsgD family transcriptional regulator